LGWKKAISSRFSQAPAAIHAINEAALPRPTLLVAGRGNPRWMPRSSRTRYLGPVRGLGRWLAAADAFVLPTIYDPFSNACLEALAAGLPVITTAANGFAEIIEPGIEGEVVADPADTLALAEAIERWASVTRRAEARERLREKGARFSVEENLRQTLRAIEGAREPL
jgi:UDP-glucose:(heptosyl)LPS alpha-1,3-glucosyltransferase